MGAVAYICTGDDFAPLANVNKIFCAQGSILDPKTSTTLAADSTNNK